MKYTSATCMVLMMATTLLSIEILQAEARYASINVNLAMNVSEDSHQLSEDMVRICAQETDISMDELRKLRQQDFKDSSEATQCFVHCIYEQMGLIRYGVFVKRDIIRTLTDATDPQSFGVHKECQNLRGGNKCETAYKIDQCHKQRELREANAMAGLVNGPVPQTAGPTPMVSSSVQPVPNGAASQWSH